MGVLKHWLHPWWHMYVYCRTAEYPNGRWYSARAGLWWVRRMNAR